MGKQGSSRAALVLISLMSVVMLAGAVWMYFDLTKMETVGGTRRMNVFVVLIYNIFGKWGVVLLVGGFGLFLLGLWLWVMIKGNGTNDPS